MMKNNFIYTSIGILVKNAGMIVLLLLLCIGQSCDDYVDVEQPNSQLTSETVFEDMTTATAAISGLYAKMRTNGIMTGNLSGISATLGMYADELDYYPISGSNVLFYNNTLLSTESSIATAWNNSYRQIYEANAIIEGVTNSISLPVVGKNQLKGEALFVRALLHFYLLNLYGDAPYVTTTDYLVNSQLSRTPSVTLYELIKADLEEAITLLPEAYVSAERVRPNRYTAYALLARVCLYTEAYAEASNAASAVINNSLYVWEPDLNKIFLKNCTSTIWQFSPAANGNNSLEGSVFIFTSGPPSNVALKPEFINSFEANDQRMINWTKAVTNGSNIWYHPYKYKLQNAIGNTSQEYSVVFRLSELYLIRAEARAKQGELINAKSDLDKIRTTAGLFPTTAVTAEEIIADIMKQRRFELFTEFGHRFFDLKRTGSLDTTLSASKPGWNTSDRLWPLPANELVLNPNLNPQNPGY